MAEVVQTRLEELLPVFELLKYCKLVEPEELAILINRCKRYEYRLQKAKKEADDYVSYIEFLNEFITLIGLRRKNASYEFKKHEIEGQLVRKINFVYNNLTERFKGDTEFFYKQIKFQKENRLYGELSKTYSKLLRFHGDIVKHHIEAGEWEFYENGSIANGRNIFQIAARKFPENIAMWEAFFKIEVEYVKTLIKRKEFLLKKDDDGETISSEQILEADRATDDVLQFKLAEVVIEEGITNIKDDLTISEFIFKCWIYLFNQTDDITKSIKEYVYGKLIGEYRILAEEKIAKPTSDLLELFDDVIIKNDSETICRIFIKIADKDFEKGDVYALLKIGDILKFMFTRGYCKAQDFSSIVEVAEHPQLPLEFEWTNDLVKETIKHVQNSKIVWKKFLEVLVTEIGDKDINQLNDEVLLYFQKMDLFDFEEICRVYYEFLRKVCKDNFDQQLINFSKRLNSSLSGYFKYFYIESLVEVKPFSELESIITEMIEAKPNSPEFYVKIADSIFTSYGKESAPLLEKIYTNGILEHGKISDDLWIGYLRYSYEYKPQDVAIIYNRAVASLEACFMSVFTCKWTKLQQLYMAA
uniref:U3 small nucleolar RNA-associated protein 6-domain-containing protein n=1 Tax=Parastrongyloides trichosuri TaxID=131310 RepID=A0A0N4ZYV9_PARTI